MSKLVINTIEGLNTASKLTLPNTLTTASEISLNVGSNEVMTVNSDGVTKFPLTTMFEVRANATQTINTSSTTKITLWGTETTDIGGVFASNAFTAPVTGKYYLQIQVRFDYLDKFFSWVTYSGHARITYQSY